MSAAKPSKTETTDKVALENDLANEKITEKYKEAASIANTVLKSLIPLIVPGVSTVSLCKQADAWIVSLTSQLYKAKKEIKKGVAFPTCINVNHICEHYTPIEDEAQILQSGDVVKVELGAHVDGYIATVGHTLVLNDNAQITGPLADATCAAYYASQAVMRTLKVDGNSDDIVKVIDQVAKCFNTQAVENIQTQEHKRYVLQAPLSFETAPVKGHSRQTFVANQVYSFNILFATQDGVLKTSTERPYLYKRNAETTYQLKLKSSRETLHHIDGAHSSVFPFPSRTLSTPRLRAGLSELSNHGMLTPLPVCSVSKGQQVVGFRLTVFLTAGGVEKITGTESPLPHVKSEHELTPELVELLKKGVKGKLRSSALLQPEAVAQSDKMDVDE